jgi:hypothetical protein
MRSRFPFSTIQNTKNQDITMKFNYKSIEEIIIILIIF